MRTLELIVAGVIGASLFLSGCDTKKTEQKTTQIEQKIETQPQYDPNNPIHVQYKSDFKNLEGYMASENVDGLLKYDYQFQILNNHLSNVHLPEYDWVKLDAKKRSVEVFGKLREISKRRIEYYKSKIDGLAEEAMKQNLTRDREAEIRDQLNHYMEQLKKDQYTLLRPRFLN